MLASERFDAIELQRMEVWANDARIVVHGPIEETVLGAPDVQSFKGRVVGEEESAVFFSLAADGTIRGMILIGERKWNVGSGVRKFERSREPDGEGFTPVLIHEIDPIDELTDPAATWECRVDRHGTASLRVDRSSLTASMERRPAIDAGNVSGATYRVRIAVETDNEF